MHFGSEPACVLGCPCALHPTGPLQAQLLGPEGGRGVPEESGTTGTATS